MRRRRQVLQVSTFPFLAVLLCAMGSLILFLLVMDRRAKAVARSKAAQEAAASQDERVRLIAEQQAEWERQRQAVHQTLAQQYRELVGQSEAVDKDTAQTAANLQKEGDHAREMQDRLASDRKALARARAALTARSGKVNDDATQAGVSRQELVRLAADLAKMERTLRDLRTLKQQDTNLVSLVPYRGKRGDNRRPIYVECAAEGVIVHPDRQVLSGPSLTGLNIRREVERRLGQGYPVAGAGAAAAAQTAYLLMLIRPDGIEHFYEAQAALEGLKMNFGLEFVDAEWALDFSSEDAGLKPWQASAPDTPPQPAKKTAIGVAAVGPANASRSASVPSYPQNMGTKGSSVVGTAPPGSGRGSGPAAEVAGKTPASGSPGLPSAMRNPGSKGLSPLPASPPFSVMNREDTLVSFSKAVDSALGQPGPQGGEAGPKGGAFSVLESANVRFPFAVRQSLPGGSASPAGVSGPASESATQGEGLAAASANPAASAKPQAADAVLLKIDHGAEPRPSGGKPRQAEVGTSGEPAAPSSTGRAVLGSPFADPWPSSGEARPAPSPLSRILGNRDLIIILECTSEGVRLRNDLHSLDSLANATMEHALVHDIQQIITRRQASVRAGETPYRPTIRFQIRPDGLRSYYMVYPLLEGLRIPMTRENLE